MRRFEEFFDNLPSGATIYEAVDDGEDFILRDFNRAAERIEGMAFRKEDLVGRRVSETFPEAKGMGLFQVLQRVWRTGLPEKLPAAYYAGGGSPGWRENHVFKLGSGEVVSVYQDITEYKKAQDFFSKVFHYSPNAMTLSGFDGKIFDANEEFCRVVERTREEVLGRSTLELGVWAFTRQREDILEAICRDGRMRGVEFQVRSKGGKVFSMLGSAEIVESGGQRLLLVTAQDITEHKRSEQALVQAQRLMSVGQLAAGVAHEINNPLAALSGEIQWLQDKTRSLPVRRSLKFMERVSKRIADIVSKLLVFSRQSPVDTREVVGVNALLEVALELLQRRLESAGVRVSRKLGKRLPSIRVDKGQIEQVLMNVLVNSLDAMPEGGRLTVVTRRQDGVVEIVVQDTGFGIPVDDLAKIFDPFFTTKPPGKGVGLGLSVSHGIVTNHGGRIEVESQEGKGTRVRIELPANGSKEAA
ncbi:MAG: ATP-binding protein [Elusimicrobiota bacterium]